MNTDSPDIEHEEEVMSTSDERSSNDNQSEDNGTDSGEHSPVRAQPVAAAPATGGMDSKNKAVFAHLSAFLTFVGIPAPIGPLVAWLILRDQDTYAADQAKEALNFNISFLLYSIVAGLAIFLLVGFVLLPVVFILWLIFPIMAAIAASRGEWYRYPMTMRFVN